MMASVRTEFLYCWRRVACWESEPKDPTGRFWTNFCKIMDPDLGSVIVSRLKPRFIAARRTSIFARDKSGFSVAAVVVAVLEVRVLL